MLKIIRIFGLLTVLALLSCEKENPDAIPRVQVNFYLYTNEPQFAPLTAVGGWAYVSGGSRGIILFRRSIDEFNAFDRHTPLNPDNDCAVLDVDSTGTYAVDRCSGSEYLLFDGSIVSGEAKTPLISYQTSFNGQVLRVYN